MVKRNIRELCITPGGEGRDRLRDVLDVEQSLREAGAIKENKWHYAGALKSARVLRALQLYCKSLSQLLSHRLGQSVKLRVANGKETENLSGGYSMSVDEGALIVDLKVFQEKLALVFPPEFVHDLSAYILKEEPSCLLNGPSDEAITAVSYFIAKGLAEDALFSKQRVYLTGAQRFKSQQDSTQTPHSLVNSEESLRLLIVAEMAGSKYFLLSFVSRELCKRIAYYTRLVVPLKELSKAILNAKTGWKIQSRITVPSLQALLELKPGDQLMLQNFSTGADGNGNSFELEQSGASKLGGPKEKRKSKAVTKLSLLPESRPGVFLMQMK